MFERLSEEFVSRTLWEDSHGRMMLRLAFGGIQFDPNQILSVRPVDQTEHENI